MFKPLNILVLWFAVFNPAQALAMLVIVSIPPQKQFVERIGGEHVEVRVMLPPGQSPETYSPSPRLLADLSRAQLYFETGVPFENRWRDAIRSVNPSISIIECCNDHADDIAHAAAQDHQDLHIWSSPAEVRDLVREIRDQLVRLDPAHANEYEENYRRYAGELDELDRAIRAQLADRRTDYFMTSHAAWGYFADEYGLTQVALENNGREGGPRTLARMVRIARQEGIQTLFVVAQFRTPFAASLARELGAATIELDPLAEDYLGNMRQVADSISKSMH